MEYQNSSRTKRLTRKNIKLMMQLKVAKQNLEAARKREQILREKLYHTHLLKQTNGETDDDVFYSTEIKSCDLHPDSCVYCLDYQVSLKFSCIKDLDEYIQRNLDYRKCEFCKATECQVPSTKCNLGTSQ